MYNIIKIRKICLKMIKKEISRNNISLLFNLSILLVFIIDLCIDVFSIDILKTIHKGKNHYNWNS